MGLRSLVEETDSAAGKVVTRTLDVTDAGQRGDFVAWAADAMGGLNGLINNAGIIRDGLLVKKSRDTGEIVKQPKVDWDTVIAVNLTGATMMVQETAARMAADGARGVIVNMSSIARHGNRGQSAYVAAKAALAANTRTWSLELARFGIRVGAIAPGLIETPLTASMNQKAFAAFIAQIPVGRVGRPRTSGERCDL